MDLVSLAVVATVSQEDVNSSHDFILAILRDFWKDLRADKYLDSLASDGVCCLR